NVFNRAWINIPLRIGLMRNLAEPSAGTILTAGAGLNFLHVMLDASAAISNKRVVVESQGGEKKVPREVALGVQLSLLFGGVDSEPEPAAPAREWKRAPKMDEQAVPTQKVRESSEKAHSELKT